MDLRRDAVELVRGKIPNTVGFVRQDGEWMVAPAAQHLGECLVNVKPSCTAQAFVQSLVCLVFGALHSIGTSLQTIKWLSLCRLTAGVIEGGAPRRSSQGSAGRSLQETFVAARRQAVLQASLSRVPHLRQHRPFAHHCPDPYVPGVLLTLEAAGSPGVYTVSQEVLLDDVWWASTVREAAERLGGPLREACDEEADRLFLKRLRRRPVTGTGAMQGVTIRARGDRVVVELEVGPFITEVSPGLDRGHILWKGLYVYASEQPNAEIDIDTVGVCVQVGQRGDKASSVNRHAFVSGRSICTSSTVDEYLRLGNGDVVNTLLECRLRASQRVLRYGWRRSNERGPHNDYLGIVNSSESSPYVVLSEKEAVEYQRQNPEVEIVRYNR